MRKFSRIQNLHISQTKIGFLTKNFMFSRIQNLHISQTIINSINQLIMFSRIQNLHISQTVFSTASLNLSLVEFKIYISLKHSLTIYLLILV